MRSTREDLLALGQRRTYFGHQSVGANVVEGLSALAREEGITLPVRVYTGPEALAEPGLAHGPIGRNEDPLSKLAAFEKGIKEGIGGRADVALFKFCYVDFTDRTDEGALFARYRDTMARLAARKGRTTIAHLTVPLTVTQSGVKGAMKTLLGRPRWGERENLVRHRFNERLRREYAGIAPIFDLARIEATRPDGSLDAFVHAGESVPRLVAANSDDGQHLNAQGRRHVGSHFASFLAGVASG